jgi:hypothetical protein
MYLADSDPTGSDGHSVDHDLAPNTDNRPWELSVSFRSVGLGPVEIDLVDYTTDSKFDGLVLSSGASADSESFEILRFLRSTHTLEVYNIEGIEGRVSK